MSPVDKIQTLAPLLADDFIKVDILESDLLEYKKFLIANRKEIGPFLKYLPAKLHDSWVLDTKYIDAEFTISLNDFSTHVFADAIIEKEKLNIPHESLVFPLIISLKNDVRVEYFSVGEEGILLKISPVDLDEYLSEQILISEKDNFEIAFEFWKSNHEMPGERIIVKVSAKELSITEYQDQEWEKIFGDKYNLYYQYFKQQFDSERYVSDFTTCLELIDELKKT